MGKATVILACVFAMASPTEASADYYLTSGQANRAAVDFLTTEYDYRSSEVDTFCRAISGRARGRKPRYHRWRCGWSAVDDCSGQLEILGRRGIEGGYWAKVNGGPNCTP
jgi:hypothetical protein